MLNTPAYILLVVYSATIVISYVIVRRGWVRAYPVFLVSGLVNGLVVFAFSLERGNSLLQAAMVGPITGIIFAAVTVVMASLYRDTVTVKQAELQLAVPASAENLALEHAHSTIS